LFLLTNVIIIIIIIIIIITITIIIITIIQSLSPLRYLSPPLHVAAAGRAPTTLSNDVLCTAFPSFFSH